MKSLKHIFLLTLFSILIFSCQKDDDVGEPQPPFFGGDVLFSTTITGQAYSDNNEPILGATVRLEGAFSQVVTRTDENGIFVFSDIVLVVNRPFLSIENPGYITGQKSFDFNGSENIFIRLKLLPKNNISSINTASGGTITTSENAQIVLPANGFLLPDASLYNGSLNVSVHHLDPLDKNTVFEMPGELIGTDLTGNTKALVSFGIMAVELNSNTGDELQLATGSKAELRFPVPNSLIADAPSTIPLWYFDEELRTWREEGEATLQNNEYVGNVAHISFWNCAKSYDPVTVNGRITDNDGTFVAGHLITVTLPSNQETVAGFTDQYGYLQVQVPVGLDLELILQSPCGSQETTIPFGPLTGYENLGDIAVDISLKKVKGSLVDCDGQVVTNGYVSFERTDISALPMIAPVSYNKYSITLPACEETEEYKVEGFNLSDSQTSGVMSYPVTNNAVIDLMACEPVDGSLIYYDEQFGLTTFDRACLFALPSGKSILWAKSADREIRLAFTGLSAGNFALDKNLTQLPDLTLQDGHQATIRIDEFGTQNKLVTGTIGGFIDGNSQVSISGHFSATNLASTTVCDIPALFDGFYQVEQVDATPAFDPANPYVQDFILQLDVVEDNIRKIYPINGFNEMGNAYLLFGCDNVVVPYLTAFSSGCNEKLIITQSDEPGIFTPDNDMEFFVKMNVEAVDGGCIDPPVESITVKFTKQ